MLHQPFFGFDRAAFRLQGDAVAGHRLGNGIVERPAADQPAAQVAIGEDALHAVLRIADRDQTQPGTT